MDYTVNFKTRAELEGAVQLMQQLERQRGQAVALQKDYSEIDAYLAKVKGSLKTFADSGEEAAKQVKEAMGAIAGEHQGNPLHMAHGHLREIHAVLRTLGPEASEAGHLLHLAFNPELLGLAAAGAAAAGLAEHVRKLREEFERLRSISLEMPELVNMFDRARDAIRDAGSEAAQFNQAIRDTVTRQESLREQLERNTKQLGDQKNLIADYIKGTEQTLNSMLEMAVHSGQLTPQQAKQIGFYESIRSQIFGHKQEIADAFKSADAVKATRTEAQQELQKSPERISRLE